MSETGRGLSEPPIRLCCMTRHSGVECPDGTFMCCMCFEKVPQTDAWRDADGTRWDCCKPCGDHNAKATPDITAPKEGTP